MDESPETIGPPTVTELESWQIAHIREFAEWHKFAEQIGQNRLYNFLMAASILFLACAQLIAADKATTYGCAAGLAVFGLLLSWKWRTIGKRQIAFHNMYQSKIEETLQQMSGEAKTMLPAYWMTEMRNPKSSVIAKDSGYWLSNAMHRAATRRTLASVPTSFGIAFTCAFAVAMYQYNKCLDGHDALMAATQQFQNIASQIGNYFR